MQCTKIEKPITQTIADEWSFRSFFNVRNYIGNVFFANNVEIVEAKVNADSGAVNVKMYMDDEADEPTWRLEYTEAYLDTDMDEWLAQIKDSVEEMKALIVHVKGNVKFY